MAAAEVNLARSAGVAGAATMTSRILGLVREQVLAYWFGASDAMDAFLVAFRVPNLVRDLFAEGAMSAALVPTFSRTLALEGRARAWQLGNAIMTALIVVTAMLVVGAMVFAPALVQLLAGDFANVPGKFELTVQLTRVMAPFLILVAVAAACMGMLNSLNIFFVPALSPAMFNVASIAVGIGLVPVAISAGVAAHPRHGLRHAGRRRRPGGAAVAAAPPRGLSLPAAPRLRRSGPAARARARWARASSAWPPRSSTCS